MKKRKLYLFAFALLFMGIFLVSIVSAAKVQINVSTYDNHKVTVSMLKPGDEYYLFDSIFGETDGFGKFSRIVETNESSLKYIIKVKNQEGAEVFTEKIDELSTSEGINLYLGIEKPADSESEPVVEEQVDTNVSDVDLVENNLEAESSGESVETSKGITANVVFDGLKKVPNWIYYVIIGVVIVGIAGFFLTRNGPPHLPRFGHSAEKLSVTSNSKGKNLSASGNVAYLESQVEEAEKKIREAKQQINKMKNVDKIKEAEEKLKKDQEELEKLKNGDD